MTKADSRAACSIWSMIESSVTSAMTLKAAGLPGLFAQRDTGLLGSASMIVTPAPFPASSVARMTAEVDFPAPPFGLAKTMVGMMALFSEGVGRIAPHHGPGLLTV